MTNWNYDGSITRFPVQPGQLWQCERGQVMACDLYDGLPPFMRAADCIFTDPPYNAALENGFRTKAGKARNATGFASFLDMLFGHIGQIAPHTCFIETGGEQVDRIAGRLCLLYPHVETYPATYYRRHPCFVVRAGHNESAHDYAGLDEQDICTEICRRENFKTIADLCMGRGLTGRAAWAAGRQFLGTELNPARLAVLINHLHGKGAVWHVDGTRCEPIMGNAAN
jgi:hypothetical protein